MAYAAMPSSRSSHSGSSPPSVHYSTQLAPKPRFVADLSQCLFDFVIQLLPTAEEMSVKEDVRKLLERLIRTIEPNSRLLSFGSTANGFSLRNSDMDLCCLIDSTEKLPATDLVTMLGNLLERETKFHVKPLPHARIPIVKLDLNPSPGLPLGIACDIGFENRLALENTRLLMCYAMIDPTRVRTMVLFLKVWSKRRKINSPYKGTLSSYGYVLLVIYFLVHVKNPPVLPNLQQLPPLRPISHDETHVNGHNVWFFDDIELLRARWRSENVESVGELLIDFFRYYSRDFIYNTGVASIRAGLLKKDSKGWQNELSAARFHDARERNRFCIEDPFEIDFNVARCVTKDGLYTIRGEFMRASRILAARPERAYIALAQLCEDRKDEELVSAPSQQYQSTLSSIPPQTPYTVGSHPTRPAKVVERLSPPTNFLNAPQPTTSTKLASGNVEKSLPEHMAPRRSQWTSPPPPEAPSADHTLFKDQLDKGLELATASTDAREAENASNSSSSNSEALSDDDGARSDTAESDDVCSIQSYTEGAINRGHTFHRSGHQPQSVPNQNATPMWIHSQDGTLRANLSSGPLSDATSQITPTSRGRFPVRSDDRSQTNLPPTIRPSPTASNSDLKSREFSRRSWSGPPRPIKTTSWQPVSDPSSSDSSNRRPKPLHNNNTVLYQTASAPRPDVLSTYSPAGASHFTPSMPAYALLSQYNQQQQQYHIQTLQSDPMPSQPSPTYQTRSSEEFAAELSPASRSGELDTPTPTSYADIEARKSRHAHSHSTATITPGRTTSSPSFYSTNTSSSSPKVVSNTLTPSSSTSHSPLPSRSPSLSDLNYESQSHSSDDRPQNRSPQLSSIPLHKESDIQEQLATATPSSPTSASGRSDSSLPSESSTSYNTSFSRSPSVSPSPPFPLSLSPHSIQRLPPIPSPTTETPSDWLSSPTFTVSVQEDRSVKPGFIAPLGSSSTEDTAVVEEPTKQGQ